MDPIIDRRRVQNADELRPEIAHCSHDRERHRGQRLWRQPYREVADPPMPRVCPNTKVGSIINAYNHSADRLIGRRERPEPAGDAKSSPARSNPAAPPLPRR